MKNVNIREFSPLTPGAFCKKNAFFGHFGGCRKAAGRLDLRQISFNPVENAFATQQLAFLATSIAFYHIVTRACAEVIFDNPNGSKDSSSCKSSLRKQPRSSLPAQDAFLKKDACDLPPKIPY